MLPTAILAGLAMFLWASAICAMPNRSPPAHTIVVGNLGGEEFIHTQNVGLDAESLLVFNPNPFNSHAATIMETIREAGWTTWEKVVIIPSLPMMMLVPNSSEPVTMLFGGLTPALEGHDFLPFIHMPSEMIQSKEDAFVWVMSSGEFTGAPVMISPLNHWLINPEFGRFTGAPVMLATWAPAIRIVTGRSATGPMPPAMILRKKLLPW